jgi:hypothetical protein
MGIVDELPPPDRPGRLLDETDAVASNVLRAPEDLEAFTRLRGSPIPRPLRVPGSPTLAYRNAVEDGAPPAGERADRVRPVTYLARSPPSRGRPVLRT